MLYFAYGSNMSSAHLRTRVGDIEIHGHAWLLHHEHRFDKPGRDGTGKGNIAPHPHRTVHGVLYRLRPLQVEQLTTFEGGYQHAECSVHHANGSSQLALTFVAQNPGAAPPPSREYLDHYREGFVEHALPPAYAHALLRDAGDDRPLLLPEYEP